MGGFKKRSEEKAMDGDYVFLCGSDLPSLRTLIGLDRLEELSDERLARMDDGIKSSFTLSYAISRLGTIAALNQDRTAVYHNGLSSTESFLHQEQIGLRYVMSLADSANRETLSYAFV
jgi:hypothetical protein